VVTRARATYHPLGNCIIGLDPETAFASPRGFRINSLKCVPAIAAYLLSAITPFEQRIKQADEKWLAEIEALFRPQSRTYHRSWPISPNTLVSMSSATFKPRPGIPPSPQHTVELIGLMKRDGVKSFLLSLLDLKTPTPSLATPAQRLSSLMPSVGGEKEITDIQAV